MNMFDAYLVKPASIGQVQSVIERLFEQGRRERALRKDPDQALPVFLMAAAKGMLQREVYGLPALEPDRAAKSLVKLFLEGAGP